MRKSRIRVSTDILGFYGPGVIPASDLPRDSVGIAFDVADAIVFFDPDPSHAGSTAGTKLVFFVTVSACCSIFDQAITKNTAWHMASDLRSIVLALLAAPVAASSRETFRQAKSLELLCATFQKLSDGTLIAADGSGTLSELDAQRIFAARSFIDERWGEKLSLSYIARECGLNRAKLTRNFRLMFACSVADAISERRMSGAREMLLATDLPISSIGYRCGYFNNASFTRAFSRHFGFAPTQLRAVAP